MILHEMIPVLIACSCLSPVAAAQKAFPSPSTIPPSSTVEHTQDFCEIVVPITLLKFTPSAKLGITGKLGPNLGIEGKFGTGFCLDPECRFIGANYHVAQIARPRKIKGEEVIQRYFATGPDDEGATVNAGVSDLLLKYTLNRDLAIFELRHSLRHHHGITFSLDGLEIGDQVDIYAYPQEYIKSFRRSLLQFHGVFKGETTTGLMAFDYSSSDGKAIHGGASGGLVVASKTQQIVGVLSGVARNGEAVALAVPVQSLADFVSRVQPWLAQSIFPPTKGSIPPASVDLYPKFIEPLTDSLQHRPDEPTAVKVLREKAQLLADSMRNFIAVQTFAWGSGDKKAP